MPAYQVTEVMAEQPLKAPSSMVVTVPGMVKVGSLVSPLKAFLPIVTATLDPRNWKDSRLVQPAKEDCPTIWSWEPSATVTVLSLLQPLKAAVPRVSKEAGSSSFSKPEPTKAHVPIFLKVDVGWNTSSFKLRVCWNASFPISSTPGVNVSLVIPAA